MKITIRLFVIALVFLIYAPHSHAFTSLDLMGNYQLSSFTIYGGGYPTLTQNDFSSFTGRVSISNQAFLMEMSGTLKPQEGGNYVYQWATGFYVVTSGNRIMVQLTGEPTAYIDIVYSASTVTTSGYDPNQGFNYSYVWQKTERLCTESQLNQAIADRQATIDNLNTQIASQAQTITTLNAQINSMFTQTQLDQAVADANAAKDLVIAEKDEIIASMYTQDQLNQAIAEVVTSKDGIIAEKDLIIASMFTQEELNTAVAAGIADHILDGDGKLDLADIIFGLQILAGTR